MEKKTIAFVVQRYGEDVNGGAEYHCRVLAEHLTEMYNVVVLTSCARSYTPWDNFYQAGKEQINGVTVIRFSVDRIRNDRNLAYLTAEIDHGNMEKEQEWIEELGPYCPKLIDYVTENSENYKVVIFFGYAFYTTVAGLERGLKNAILIPTAHDEPNIYRHIYIDVIKKAKSILYNSIEERDFLIEHFHTEDKLSDLTCVGIDIPQLDDESVPEAFRKYENYIIYVGRISPGKNFYQLNRYFLEYKKRNPSDLKLLVIGRSDNYFKIINHADIIYTGFVSEEEKTRLIKNAKILIMPSKWESLSLVILESMAVRRPILVNGECAVLKGQCIRSNAGLYYTNYKEFEYTLNYMLTDKEAYNQMCENGLEFVRKNYNWDIVVNNVSALIEKI